MIKKTQIFLALVSGMLFCVVTLAQTPVVDIDQSKHVNLADAQRHVVAANAAVLKAQQENKYDMQGHAEKARDLLVQVNQELKAAAAAANAQMQKKK
jgi:GAF domain-containing protein